MKIKKNSVVELKINLLKTRICGYLVKQNKYNITIATALPHRDYSQLSVAKEDISAIRILK